MKSSRPAATLGFVIALSFAASVSAGFLKTASADETCTIAVSDLEGITAARALGLASELTARRALLTRVVGCAKSEARSLQASLGNVAAEGNAKAIKSQLGDKLYDAINYYDIELGKASDAGIAGTQAIAREVLAWREANYDPLAGQVANFTLWTQNQNLFTVAAGRLGQVRSIVSFITQAAPNNDLQNALSNAESLVQTANDENQTARNAFLQSLPPDASLTLIKQSLQSLSDAYQKFSDISTIVRTLLSAKGA